MGGATAKSRLPHFKGMDPDSTRWISVFYSFQLSVQSTKITLCSPTPIQFPKNPVSLLTIYPGSYCTFCQGKSGQGLQWLYHYFFVLMLNDKSLINLLYFPNFFMALTEHTNFIWKHLVVIVESFKSKSILCFKGIILHNLFTQSWCLHLHLATLY